MKTFTFIIILIFSVFIGLKAQVSKADLYNAYETKDFDKLQSHLDNIDPHYSTDLEIQFYKTLFISDGELAKEKFTQIAQELEVNEAKIAEELLTAQGEPMDIGGYYLPDTGKTEKAMRPSQTFNSKIDKL